MCVLNPIVKVPVQTQWYILIILILGYDKLLLASRCNEVDNKHNYIYTYNYFKTISCPPWFKPSNGTCIFGESIDGIVRCNESLLESAILESYWMTYNEATETVVIGACFYNCVNNAFKELSTILCQVLVSN